LTLRRLRRIGAGGSRSVARPAGVALVYHKLAAVPGDPRSELVPAFDLRLFEAHLDHLRANYRVVAPSELLQAASERQPQGPVPVAITFDDDLPSHVDLAAPALVRANLPAAFFLCGCSIEGPHSFWWEDLQALADAGRPGPAKLDSVPELDLGPTLRGAPGAIHEAAELIERLPPERRDAAAAELRSHAGRPSRGLRASDIASLAAAGFELGFHTRHHYLLPTLHDEALPMAMSEGRERLEAVTGRRLTMIAYPHGKANARVARAARTAGYELGFTGFARPAVPAGDPLLIGRLDAHLLPLDMDAMLDAVLARAVRS
jgi:peptidoglycan/xylan/chitin deacetylase (PgdA/CDA1 family)